MENTNVNAVENTQVVANKEISNDFDFKHCVKDVAKVSVISAGTYAGIYGVTKLVKWIKSKYDDTKKKDKVKKDPEIEHVSGTVEG